MTRAPLLLALLPILTAGAPGVPAPSATPTTTLEACSPQARHAHGVGSELLRDGQASEAARAFAGCLGEPTCLPCHWEAGWAAWQQRDWWAARDHWSTVAALQPDHAEVGAWLPKASARAYEPRPEQRYRVDAPETAPGSELRELAFVGAGVAALPSCKTELASIPDKPRRPGGKTLKHTPPTADPSGMPDRGRGDLASLPGRDIAALPVEPLRGPARVLDRIRNAVLASQAGERVRWTVYGASHTSADRFTGQLRRVLQQRGADGGHGWILPAELYKWHGGRDVALCRTEGWLSDWAHKANGHDDALLGAGGMAVSSGDARDFGWMQTTGKGAGSHVESFEVHALRHPDGGTLRVTVDGEEQRIPTAGEPGLLRLRIALPDGAHRLRLAPAGDGVVRLFGVSMERKAGAIVDAVGIRGREARSWLTWDEASWQTGLRALDPDVVVLAYGTNEANDQGYDMKAYRDDLAAVLRQLRRTVSEDVPCILAGPSDRFVNLEEGRWAIWDRTDEVAAVQAELAPLFGCASWDWQAAQGGQGSMIAQLHTDPPLSSPDGIHHTPAGYVAVADRFLAALDALTHP